MPLTIPVGSAVAVTAVAVGAALLDARTRRIPNLLTGSALAAGLAAHAVAGGLPEVLGGVAGALVAGGLLLPGWLMGWMGAGDVKLMAAAGAWLGYPQSLVATLASLIAGGIVALVVAVRHRSLGRALRGAAMLGAWGVAGARRAGPPPAMSGIRFPFAAAILAGCLVALWFRS